MIKKDIIDFFTSTEKQGGDWGRHRKLGYVPSAKGNRFKIDIEKRRDEMRFCQSLLSPIVLQCF